MTQRMAEVAQKMSDWVTAKPRTLEETEKMTLQTVKELGNALLASLIRLNVPAYPEEKVPCPCGQTVYYERMRPAPVDTLLGTITLARAVTTVWPLSTSNWGPVPVVLVLAWKRSSP